MARSKHFKKLHKDRCKLNAPPASILTRIIVLDLYCSFAFSPDAFLGVVGRDVNNFFGQMPSVRNPSFTNNARSHPLPAAVFINFFKHIYYFKK